MYIQSNERKNGKLSLIDRLKAMSDGEFCAYFVDIIQNRLDKLPIRIFN